MSSRRLRTRRVRRRQRRQDVLFFTLFVLLMVGR